MSFKKANSQYLFLVAIIVLIVSCTESRESKDLFADIPIFTPSKIKQFEKIDSVYFSYLGIDSFPTKEGGFILSVWDPGMLVKTGPQWNSISAETKKGRGPGEFLSIGRPTMGEDRLYVYDQYQTKIVVLERSDLSLAEELVIEPYQDFRGSRVYPAFSNGILPLVLGQSQMIIEKMGQQLLIQFDPENEEYGKSIPLKGIAYAPLDDLKDGRSGSAIQVPFSEDQLIAPIPESKTLLLYDTRTDLIAEINAALDTVRAISVNLPTENVSDTAKSKIMKEYDLSEQDWKYVESYIPEVKAKAADMIYFDHNIWLKSNVEAEGSNVWLVLNMTGEIVYRVHLPKNSYLTHVSNHHLGVRLDEVNFALYENPLAD